MPAVRQLRTTGGDAHGPDHRAGRGRSDRSDADGCSAGCRPRTRPFAWPYGAHALARPRAPTGAAQPISSRTTGMCLWLTGYNDSDNDLSIRRLVPGLHPLPPDTTCMYRCLRRGLRLTVPELRGLPAPKRCTTNGPRAGKSSENRSKRAVCPYVETFSRSGTQTMHRFLKPYQPGRRVVGVSRSASSWLHTSSRCSRSTAAWSGFVLNLMNWQTNLSGSSV